MSIKDLSARYESLNEYKPFAPHDGIVDGPLEYVPVLRTRLPWQSDASAVGDLEARKSGH
jgi:hypothetical protein